MTEKPLSILAIDLGQTLGWAYTQGDLLVASGEHVVYAGGHQGKRAHNFSEWLREWKDAHFDFIVFEQAVHHKSQLAARSYWALYSKLFEWCFYCDIMEHRIIGYKPSELKQQFTGKGNSDKLVMCSVAHRLGWQGGKYGTERNNNEADAIALAWVFLQSKGIDMRFT